MNSEINVYIIVGVTVGAVAALVTVGLSIMFFKSRQKSNRKLARQNYVFDLTPTDSGKSTHHTAQNILNIFTNDKNSEMLANELYVSAGVSKGMAFNQKAIYSEPIKKQNSETVNNVLNSL